jgi:hypothetical protein
VRNRIAASSSWPPFRAELEHVFHRDQCPSRVFRSERHFHWWRLNAEVTSHSMALVLVPSTAPEYDALVADIEERLAKPVDGAPRVPERFRQTITPEDPGLSPPATETIDGVSPGSDSPVPAA